MGSFGSGREDCKNMKPVERSMADLSERRPVLAGPGRDTFVSDDGKHFVMGREVEKGEYDAFMDRYEALIDHQYSEKEQELKQAA